MAAGGRIFSPVAQEKRKIGRSFRGLAPSSRRKLARLIIPVRSAGLARVRVCLGVGTRWALAIAAGTGFR